MIETNYLLLLYHHPDRANAPTILDDVASFVKYSKYPVVRINTWGGFPSKLYNYKFSVIILHYSIFGTIPFELGTRLKKYISASKSLKIAFFQDEMRHCRERFAIIDLLGIDIVYTLLAQRYHHKVYFDNTNVQSVRTTLTGYVSDDLIEKGKSFYVPFDKRIYDIGYRARRLDYFYGQGSLEKSEIAERFLLHTSDSNLKVNISIREEDRIYGDAWYRFVGNCRFMLGAMAGTSIFDFNGEVRLKTEEYLKSRPGAGFQEVAEKILAPYEGNVIYRTISPRLFECAALRVGMILYRDDYQGVLEADRHYIPLEKDFSNIESVLLRINDRIFVDTIIDNAYQDLILSGKYHYRIFMNEMEKVICDHGLDDFMPIVSSHTLDEAIRWDEWVRKSRIRLKKLQRANIPGRRFLKKLILGIKS